MKKQKLLDKKIIANCIAVFAIAFSSIGANSCCCCIFHQPNKPELEKLRRY